MYENTGADNNDNTKNLQDILLGRVPQFSINSQPRNPHWQGPDEQIELGREIYEK